MTQAFQRAKGIIEAMRAKVERARDLRVNGSPTPSSNSAPDLAKAELPKVAPPAAPAPQRAPSPYGRATPLSSEEVR